MSSDVDKFRREIDQLDEQILRLLNKRAELAIQIGKHKKDHQGQVHVPQREREIFARLEKLNTGPFPGEAIRHVFREIISASLSLEAPLKVAYLGPKATFTHMVLDTSKSYSALDVTLADDKWSGVSGALESLLASIVSGWKARTSDAAAPPLMSSCVVSAPPNEDAGSGSAKEGAGSGSPKQPGAGVPPG